jgi:hypothetical protein
VEHQGRGDPEGARDGLTAHFPSKRDTWLSVVLWAAVIACVAGGAATAAEQPDALIKAVVFAVPAAVAALVLWVLYGTSYTFSGQVLDIRSGPFRFRVPLHEILSVDPSRNPLSAPACSLDRLHIRYGHRQILVSPQDRSGFLDALVARGTGLVRDGDRVVKGGDALTARRSRT